METISKSMHAIFEMRIVEIRKRQIKQTERLLSTLFRDRSINTQKQTRP